MATGPSDPRGSSTRRSWPLQSHTRLEALRYDGLCCPRRSSLVRPPPTSARRSATSRAALIGFAVTGHPRTAPWSRGFRCRDGSLLFRAGLCDRSAPTTPTGLWCCTSKIYTPFMAFTLGVLGSAPACSPLTRGFFTTRIQDSSRTDRSLARRPKGDFVMALRQSGLPFRRPPATGPLGRYPDRTLTGKPTTASRTHIPCADFTLNLLGCAATQQSKRTRNRERTVS